MRTATRKITWTLIGMFTLTCFAGCSAQRTPLVLHEPTYSYLRSNPDATQLSAANPTQRVAKAEGDTAIR